MEYNPREDDEVYVGTKFLDQIEGGVIGSVQWLQKQAEENPDTYTDDVFRLLGGGVKNIGWAISKIPLLDKLAQGEDWLAGQARNINEQLTPWLDPRFAGWGTRIGTGILADKGARKVLKTIKGAGFVDELSPSVGAAKFGQLSPSSGDIQSIEKALNPERLARIKSLKNTLLEQANQTKQPISKFQSISYQEKVISKMAPYGMKDGVFRMKAFDATKGITKGNIKERAMLEAYLSPDRLRGSFSGFDKVNRPGFANLWADFIEAKGLNRTGDIQIHHKNPLYDSIHLFDGVGFNSKEYWDVIETLIDSNARTGVVHRGDDVNNLMMTLGKAQKFGTPHGIAHKFLNKHASTFFDKKEMQKMAKSHAYRLQKARKWAVIVNKSEQIMLEAHKQWSLLNPKIAGALSFDELVEELSKYNDFGYKNLLSTEFQLPDLENLIKTIVDDLTKSPLPNLSRSGFRSWVKQQNLPELYKVYLGEARRIKVFEDILLSNKKPTQIIKELKGWDPDMVQLKLALNESFLRGAAIDVYSEEPAKNNILFGSKNLILTPHIAASTEEAQIIVAKQIA